MTIEFTENSATIKEDKNAITEAYCDLGPNESLMLSKEKIKVKNKGKEFNANGEIWLNLLPKPSVRIDITFPTSSPDIIASLAMNFDGEISIPSRKISSSILITNQSFGSNQPLSISAIAQERPLVTKKRGKIATAFFSLINLGPRRFLWI